MIEELKKIISERNCWEENDTVLGVIVSLLNNCKEEDDLDLPVSCFAPSSDDPFYFGDGPFDEAERREGEMVLKFKESYWC